MLAEAKAIIRIDYLNDQGEHHVTTLTSTNPRFTDRLNRKSMAAIEVFYDAIGCSVMQVQKCEVSGIDLSELLKGGKLTISDDVASILYQSQAIPTLTEADLARCALADCECNRPVERSAA